jgi:VPDSG-CTERM motif
MKTLSALKKVRHATILRPLNLSILAFMGLLMPTFARAGTLTFDDVAVGSGWGYQSLGDGFYNATPDSAEVYGNLAYGSAPFPSGDQVLINYDSNVGGIKRTTTFDFDGAYFHSDNRYGTSDTVAFAGYDASGNLMYSTTLLVTDTWTFLTFDWAGISEFTWNPISPTASENIAIDNFTYDSSVPDSGTTATLLGSALLGLAALRRRFARA